MADIEKVIEGLSFCTNDSCDCTEECPYSGMNCCQRLKLDALELLKEQQNEIKRLEGWNMTLTSQVEF